MAMSENDVKLPNKLLNSAEIAQILGTSKGFAYSLMRRGEIRTVRMGKAVRVRPVDLQVFIDESLDPEQNGKKAW